LGPTAGFGWYTADKDEPVCATMERLATLPFAAQPGESFVYGYNTDVLGCVVERASGMPLDVFVATRITGPLGMRDTHFFLPASKRNRLVAVYASDSANHAVRAPDGSRGQGSYVDGPRRNFAGGAGILSTTRDYARFLSMMLNRGALDGVRYLSPKSVDLMTTDQTGGIFGRPGLGFGLGFQVVMQPGGEGLATVGTFGWNGAYGTTGRVDPREHLVMLFLMNQVSNRADVMARFQTLVYQALVEPRTGWASAEPR
ncbi:MAG: serine hydrolase, partial [Gemmatimonadaceae bacterium]|nr:serine hydrolase [Gemmatimonadaceae bacterium]